MAGVHKDINIEIKDYDLTIDINHRRVVQSSYDSLEELLGEVCLSLCNFWYGGKYEMTEKK